MPPYISNIPRKFWKTKEFAETYAPGVRNKPPIPKTIQPAPPKKYTVTGKFKRNAPVFFNPEKLEFSTDTTKNQLFLGASRSDPNNLRIFFDKYEADRAARVENLVVTPMIYDETTELYLKSIEKDMQEGYVEAGIQAATPPAAPTISFGQNTMKRVSVAGMSDAQRAALAQDYEQQGYTVTTYDDEQEEEPTGSGVDWTKDKTAKLGAFKKLTPDEWWIASRAGPSTADQTTIWTQSTDGIDLEPTAVIKGIANRGLDLTNVVNSAFGIAGDATSLRGTIGRSREKDPFLDAGLAYTTDIAILGAATLGSNIRTALDLMTGGLVKGLLNGNWYWKEMKDRHPELSFFGKIGQFISDEFNENKDRFTERVELIGSNINRATENLEEYKKTQEYAEFKARHGQSETLEDVHAYRLELEKKRVEGIQTQESYREQAKVSMQNNDFASAVLYTRKAQEIDRALGFTYWENEAIEGLEGKDLRKTKFSNSIGTLYSKLNTSSYEDWTWALKPELEEKFLLNMAYAEIQLGRPLTVFEINTVRNKYVDPSISMIGDIALDPSTYFAVGLLDMPANLIKLVRGTTSATAKAARASKVLTKTADILKESAGWKFSERFFKPFTDRILSVKRTEKWVKHFDTVTEGAGRVLTPKTEGLAGAADELAEVLADPEVRVSFMDWLRWVPKRLSVRSGGNKLFQVGYELVIPVADWVRNISKNVLKLTLPEVMDNIAKYSTSVDALRGAMRKAEIPVMSERTMELWVKLNNSVPSIEWKQLMDASENLVRKAARDEVMAGAQVALNYPTLATEKDRKLIKIIEDYWGQMMEDPNKTAITNWINARIKQQARNLSGKGKRFANYKEALAAMEEWINGPELIKEWKPQWVAERIADAAENAAKMGAEDARRAALKWAEALRSNWLNQVGVSKLWNDASDITTDSLIAALDRARPEWFTSKINGEDVATGFRKFLINIRNVYKGSLNFIFSAVLSGRPGYLITNWIDSNFRALVYGVRIGEDVNTILDYYRNRASGLPMDLFQSLSRDFLINPNSKSTQFIQGLWKITNRPFADWGNLQKFHLGETRRLERASLQGKLAQRAADRARYANYPVKQALNKIDDFLLKAKTETLAPIKSFMNANADFNNFTEIIVRLKTYHKYYINNLDKLEPEFMARVMEKVPLDKQDFVMKLIKRSENNPIALAEMIQTKDPSVLYSQYIPEETQKIIQRVDSYVAHVLVKSVQKQYEEIILTYLDNPEKQRKMMNEFFNNLVTKFEKDTNTMQTRHLGLQGIHTGGDPSKVNVTKNLDEAMEQLEKEAEEGFVLDGEAISAYNDIKNGRKVEDDKLEKILKRNKIKSEKGKGKEALVDAMDKQNAKNNIPIVEDIYESTPDGKDFIDKEARRQAMNLQMFRDYDPEYAESVEKQIRWLYSSYKQLKQMINIKTPEGVEQVYRLNMYYMNVRKVSSAMQELISQHPSLLQWHGKDKASYISKRFYSWLKNANQYEYTMFNKMVNDMKQALDAGKPFKVPEIDLDKVLKDLGITIELDGNGYIKRWSLFTFDMENAIVSNTTPMFKSLRESLFGVPVSDIPDKVLLTIGDVGIAHTDYGKFIPYKMIPEIKTNWTAKELMDSPGVTELIGSENPVEGLTAAVKRAIKNLDITSTRGNNELLEETLLKRLKVSAKIVKVKQLEKLLEAKTLHEISKIYQNTPSDLFEVVSHAGNLIVSEGKQETITSLVRGFSAKGTIFQSIRGALRASGWSKDDIQFATRLVDVIGAYGGAVRGVSKDEFLLRTLAGITNMDANLDPVLLFDAAGNTIRHSPLKNRLDDILTQAEYKSGKELAKALRESGIGEFSADTPEIKWFMDWLESPAMNSKRPINYKLKKLLKDSKALDESGNPLDLYHATANDYDIHNIRMYPERAGKDIGFHVGTLDQAETRASLLPFTHPKGTVRIHKIYLNVKNPLVIERDLGRFNGTLISEYLIESGDSTLIEMGNKITAKSNDMIFHPYKYPGTDMEYMQEFGRIVPDVMEEYGYDGIKYLNEVEGAIKMNDKGQLLSTHAMAVQKNNYSWMVWNQNQIIPAVDEIAKPSTKITKEEIFDYIDEVESQMPTKLPGEANITNPNYGLPSLHMDAITGKELTYERLRSLLPEGTIKEDDLRKILKNNNIDINSPEFDKLNEFYKSKQLGGELNSQYLIKLVENREKALRVVTDSRILQSLEDMLAKEWPELPLTEINKGGFLMPNGKVYGFSESLGLHGSEEEKMMARLAELIGDQYDNLDFLSPIDFGAVRVTNGARFGHPASFDITGQLTKSQRNKIVDYMFTLQSGDRVVFDYLSGTTKKMTVFKIFDDMEESDILRNVFKDMEDTLPQPMSKQRILNFKPAGGKALEKTSFMWDSRAIITILTESKNSTVMAHGLAHYILPYLSPEDFKVFMDWATNTKYGFQYDVDGQLRILPLKQLKALEEDLARRGIKRGGKDITVGKPEDVFDIKDKEGRIISHRVADRVDSLVSKNMDIYEFQELHRKVMIENTANATEQELYHEIQEAFANGLTVHVAEGGGMSSELRKIFNRIKEAVVNFYRTYVQGGALDVKLNKEMRDFYGKLLGEYPAEKFVPGKSVLENKKPVYGIPVYARGTKEAAEEGVTIPIITPKEMKTQLLGMGYSTEEISKMSQAEIFEKLGNATKTTVSESEGALGVGRYYHTNKDLIPEAERVEKTLHFSRPYVLNTGLERESFVRKFGLNETDRGKLLLNMKNLKIWMREQGFDGIIAKEGRGHYQILDYKITEEEQAIWNAIINNPKSKLSGFNVDAYSLDLSSPEAFLSGARQRLKQARAVGNDTTALAWSALIDQIQTLLRRIPRNGEKIKDIPITGKLSDELEEGLATAIQTLEYDLESLEQVKGLFRSWKDGFNKKADDIAKGVSDINYQTKPDDAWWEELNRLVPDIAKEMKDLEDVIVHGGKYGNVDSVRGALNQTNEILLDYTTHYELENLPRLIFPFWQFPTRSAPFWAKTLVIHPEIMRYYTKYQLQSYRERLQGGMVTSDGVPVKSLAGYIRLPGTDFFWNPTAPLSFRLLFPSAYQNYGDTDMNEKSVLGSVISSMQTATKLRGISMNPYVLALAIKMGWIEDEGQQYSIIPQVDLVPRFFQRYILGGLRKVGWDNAPELWSPSVTYKDYLIEQMILKDTLEQINEMKEAATGDEYLTDAYKLTANVAHLLSLSPAYRRADTTWMKYLNKYEWSETGKSWMGFMTGVYGKKYTEGDAQFNLLRNEINLLKSSLNNETQTQLFKLAKDQADLSEKYNIARYDTPGGELWSLYQGTRWVTDANGAELTGDDRIRKINETVTKNTDDSKYYSELEAIYNRRDEALADLPIGSPSSVRSPIIEAAIAEIEKLDEQYGRTAIEFSVYNKTPDAILKNFETKWWKELTATEPKWEAETETYAEYKTRWDEWAKNLPQLSKEIGGVYLLVIKPQLDAIFAQQVEGELGAADIKTQRELAEQGIIELMQADGNLEGYIRHKRENDTATDALMEAWTVTYLEKYYEYTEGKRYEEYLLAERKFKAEFPNPPTFEQLAEWVMQTYPAGKFDIEDLREAYEDADEEVLSMEERRAMDMDDKETVREKILDILEIVGPGNLSIDFNNLYASPTIGGTKDDITDIYSNWESFTLEDLNAMLSRMQKAASLSGVSEPSNAELMTRVQARNENDVFKELVREKLGVRFYEDQSWFYETSYGEQAAYKKLHPEFAELLDMYKEMKAAYADMNPIWAKYYFIASEEKKKSGGGGGTLKSKKTGPNEGGGGSGWVNYGGSNRYSGGGGWTNYGSGESSILGQYLNQSNKIGMGYRSSLDAKKLLSGSLGSGGTGGLPKWPPQMIKGIEFALWSDTWPRGMKETMGDVLLSSLKERYIYGTALSKQSIGFLNKLARNHPEWRDSIQDIAKSE